MLTRGQCASALLAALACSASLMASSPSAADPLPEARSPLVDPCMAFTDPNFAYSSDQVSALMSTDYARLRAEIAECQGTALTELKAPKMKKPKVPKVPGTPPAFWVYVMGSQVEMWNWSLPLEPDPVMCTAAISGQRFTAVSPVPAGAVLGSDVGNQVSVPVRVGVKDTGWGRGSDCDPTNWSGSVDGNVSFDFSSSGIRLTSYISSERDLAWEYTNNSDADFFRKFTKKDQAALRNPRKGVLTFMLDHSASGSAQTDDGFGSCAAWGDDGSCTWAHSWGLKVVLVRADPMDLVYGP